MDLREVFGVMVAGALGALSRAGALEASESLASGPLLANFSANIIGAFGLGFVVAHGMLGAPTWLRSSVTVGFFGSYTTFSALALLSITEPLPWGAVFLIFNIFFGVLAVVAGQRVAQLILGANKK